MNVMLPIVKEVEEVDIDDQTLDQRTGEIKTVCNKHKVVVRDDGGVLLNLLSQINWNKDFKGDRKNMTKIVRRLRKWNFEHSRAQNYTDEIEIDFDKLKRMRKILCEEYPNDLQLVGANALITLDELEDFCDTKQAEVNLAEKDKDVDKE